MLLTMNRLCRSLKWFWKKFDALLISLLSSLVVISFFKEGKVTFSPSAFQWLLSPTILYSFLSILTILAVLTLIACRSDKKVKQRNNFDLCKTTDKLTPEDLGFLVLDKSDIAKPGERPFYKNYVFRSFHSRRPSDKNFPATDIDIIKSIKKGNNILLVGQPTEGKTRTAYELLKGLSDFTVLRIKSNKSTFDNDAFSIIKNKSVIIFIDDLSDYIDGKTDLKQFYEEVKKVAQQCVILATCREGAELSQITQSSTQSLQRFYEKFDHELAFIPITVPEKQKIAAYSGLSLKLEQVHEAPTPGWIVMEDALRIVEKRFRNQLSSEAVDTLRSLKLLAIAGVFPLTQERTIYVLKDIFQRQHIHLPDILEELCVNAFLERPSIQNPIQPEAAYLSRVVTYTEGKNLLDDFAILGQLLEDSEDFKGLNSLAITYAEGLNDYSTAHTYSQRSVDLNTNFPEAWNTLGAILTGLGQYEEAVAAYQQAIAIDENYPQAWYNLGNTFARYLEQYENAINAYQQAVAIDKNLQQAWNNLGITYHILGRYKEAIAAHVQAIAINENFQQAWDGLGNVLFKLGQYQEAIDAYRRAIQIDKSFSEAWNNMGVTLYRLKRYEEALEAFEQIDFDPFSIPLAWYFQSKLLLMFTRYKEALEIVQRAQETIPQEPLCWSYLGITLLFLERKKEAIKWLCKAWQVREMLPDEEKIELKDALDRVGLNPANCNS